MSLAQWNALIRSVQKKTAVLNTFVLLDKKFGCSWGFPAGYCYHKECVFVCASVCVSVQSSERYTWHQTLLSVCHVIHKAPLTPPTSMQLRHATAHSPHTHHTTFHQLGDRDSPVTGICVWALVLTQTQEQPIHLPVPNEYCFFWTDKRIQHVLNNINNIWNYTGVFVFHLFLIYSVVLKFLVRLFRGISDWSFPAPKEQLP